MNKRIILRVLSLLLLLSVLLFVLPSCGEKELLTTAPTLTVNEKGELTLAMRVTSELLKEHAGKKATLIELEPGEDAAAAAGKQPLLQEKLTAKLKFQLPIRGEAEKDRRYCGYMILLSDGTALTPTPVYLSNPEVLAPARGAFPQEGSVKGVGITSTALSLSLSAGHGLAELSLSALLNNGTEVLLPARPELLCNAPLLLHIDTQIRSASDAGLQVILQITPDAPLSAQDQILLIDTLLERYSGGERGRVTTVILKDAAPRTSQNAATRLQDVKTTATLLRACRTALCSRFAQGRVYLAAEGTPDELRAFYIDAHEAVKAGGSFLFGAAVIPDPVVASQAAEKGKNDNGVPYLNLSDLPELAKYLAKEVGRANRFAVVGLSFPSAELDEQAALVSLSYRAAMAAKADFMIYQNPIGDERGLYSAAMVARPAAEIFRVCDTDGNKQGQANAEQRFPEDWKALETKRPARVHIQALANAGTSGGDEKLLFDFSGKAPAPAFASVGNGTAPTLCDSAAFGTQVLASSLKADATTDSEGSGYLCALPDPTLLKNSYVLSALLLPQCAGENATVTLKLQGTAADGRALSYTSAISLAANTWQSVSFHVREFTSQMDADAPCYFALLLQPVAADAGGDADAAADSTAEFALWLHSVNTRAAAPDLTLPLIALTAALGFSAAILLVILLRRSRKKRR